MASSNYSDTSDESPKVSVIIRAFNEAKHIGRLLHDVFAQEIAVPIEVILVDSGSTDATLEIASRYPVHIVRVNAENFTFGYSLNQGLRAARGEFCAIVSAHCYPTDTNWLQNLTEPFVRDPKVALVYGRQRGYTNTRYSEHQIFAKWFPDVSNFDCGLAFCNNANSAIRRSVWLDVPFDETLTGLEDIAWGKAIMSKGYRIAYCANACIYHIHEESAQQIYRRYYREAMAYKGIFRDHHFNFFSFLKYFGMNSIGDYYHALQEGKLLANLLDIPLFRFLQFWATYRAHCYREPMSKEMKRRLYYPRRPRFLKGALFTPTPTEPSPCYIDISRPITQHTPVWPGDTPVTITSAKTISQHGVNVTDVSFCVHTATHIDAPEHFVEGGGFTHEVELEKMIGDACVIEYRGKEAIHPGFLESLNIPANVTRLLLKTKNSQACIEQSFDPSFVAITSSSAHWLVNRGIQLVGIDGPSIQAFDDADNATHEILLRSKVVILEGLNLKEVAPGRYRLIALPLHIPNIEGAPVRAILTKQVQEAL